MGKKRIHELAKELSLASAELIQKIMEWDLLPSAKLTASSGVEDYMAEEIARRLNRQLGSEAAQAAPQVVRRRKKVEQLVDEVGAVSDQDVEAPASAYSEDEQSNPETGQAPAPVFVKIPKSESARIISKTSPPFLKNAQVNKNVPAPAKSKIKTAAPDTPDFIKLVPAVEPEPVVPVKQQTDVPKAPAKPMETQPRPVPVKGKTDFRPAEGSPPNRKITRELGSGEQARIISSPRERFETAKVVGVKPNWKDAPESRTGGDGPRHAAGDRRPGGPRPASSASPASPRPASGRPPAPGARPPAGGRPPDFRRIEPVAAPEVTEAENRRRVDNKKKKSHGGRHEGDEGAANKATRRREVVDLYSEGDWARVRRRGKNVKKLKTKAEPSTPKAIKRRIKVDEVITVSELALRLAIKAGDIIKKLMTLGVMAGVNQALDFDTATLVAAEFGYEVEKSAFDEEHILQVEYKNASPKITRSPVVTIMGHVDHGKTSLLDYIRKTNIQGGEAGGITQHIGAYHVQAGGRHVTFLDTPGHEAFTSMRSRGAQVTDIVVLIVAADDGVMPQTREAADHARAAGVPIIVAVNKVDKPAADVEKVRREMMEIGLVAEAWGGDTVFVEISAKTGQGVDGLLDMILLQADILELKSRPDGPAKGRIIEARLDKGRGPVATVLVQEGLLRQGDPYVCGVFYGKIRALLDDQGNRVAEAGPAMPVEIQGISGVPQAGDAFIALEDEKQARQVSQHRLLRQRESELTQTSKLTLENLFDNIKAGAVKGLNLIIKTDVQGSLEAIVDAVMKLSTSEMKINVIHQSTGAVSETDIMLASASTALVIGFGVRPSAKVQDLADSENVQIRYYDVIYQLLDDIKEAMAGLLDPVKSEKVLGRAEVRVTFAVSKVGTIAGSYVIDGKIVRGARGRLVRDGVVVHDGKISSLKRHKDDAKEVASGYECGIGFENFNDLKIGDVVEAYLVEETAPTVELIDEALARAAKEKIALAKEKAAAEAKEKAAAEANEKAAAEAEE